jgi:tyrosinase
MPRISRRSLVRAGAIAAASTPFFGFERFARAGPAAKVIRHDVVTAEGQKMLKIYASAVGKMMATTTSAPGNPRSWLFQWYTHAVPSNTRKDREIGRIYTNPGDPNRALATAMWDTCEAHPSNPSSKGEKFFLPWHRLYVRFFEQSIRNVSGKPEFTLPYWNYTGPGSDSSLPKQFQLAGDAVWGPLFRRDRNRGVNGGTPVDGGPGGPMTLNAMKSSVYDDSGSDAGFCANVDNDPHGALHVNVGNSRGMGQVPWAANDPVFWLHHCNIDRIWASWAKAGGKNPNDATFKNTMFSFVDGSGNGVQGKVADILELADLDYEYDRYLDRPPGSPPFLAPSAAIAMTVHAVSRQISGPVTLGASPATVALATQEVPSLNLPSGANTLAAHVQAVGADRVFYLRLNHVRASAAPDAGYEVYLGYTGQAAPRRSDPSFVGSISFFGVAPHEANADHAAATTLKPRNYSFIVTNVVKQLQQAGRLTEELNVTLVPAEAPSEGSAPTIGSVSLVSS